MTAAAVARAAAGAERRAKFDAGSRNATKVCSPPLCYAVPVLSRPVLRSTGYNIWKLLCRPQAAEASLAVARGSQVQALL